MPDGAFALGFDTSAAHCAAAIVFDGRVLASRTEPMARGQAERLMPLLNELLAEGGLGWSDLTVLGVGIGPGNFTGIRISVAAARGLALALQIPAHGVTLTEAGALGAPRPCRAVVPLRGGEVAWQDFGGPTRADQGDVAQFDGAPGILFAAEAGLPPGPPPVTPHHPLPEAIARIAAARLAAGISARPPAPVYLRPADAAPPRDPAPRLLP